MKFLNLLIICSLLLAGISNASSLSMEFSDLEKSHHAQIDQHKCCDSDSAKDKNCAKHCLHIFSSYIVFNAVQFEIHDIQILFSNLIKQKPFTFQETLFRPPIYYS